MAVTLSVERAGLWNLANSGKKVGGKNMGMIMGTVTMDSSYPTNGETLDLSSWFANDYDIERVFFFPYRGLSAEYVAATPSTGLIKVLNAPVGAERAFTYNVPLDGVLIVPGANGTTTYTNESGAVGILRTATGADTNIFCVNEPVAGSGAGLGWKVTASKWFYEITTADATSVDNTCDSVAYVQATAPAVTANACGAVVDGDYDTDNNTAAKRADKDVTGGEHVMVLTYNTPAYFATANAHRVHKQTVVLANTGTYRLRGVQLIGTELLVATATGGAEVSNTTSLSGVAFPFIAYGTLKPN